MSGGNIEKLTERQKECLRLIVRGFETKEAARELGISPTAVVERLRSARRALGVETSREAARLLAAAEAPGTNTWRVDMPPELADVAYPLPPGSSAGDAGLDERLRLREVSAPFAAVDVGASIQTYGLRLPWRRRGAKDNDLTGVERLVASGGLSIAIAVCSAIILTAVVQLMTFLIQISRHGG
jgi:DNA-binding CsgD family transcriptional regulator